MFKLKTTGIAKMRRALVALQRDAGKAARAAADAMAKPIEAEAKLLAAVDTGAMQAGIHTVASQAGQTAIASVQTAEETPYAVHIEYGTARSPAQPFMRPAAENKREEAIAAAGVAAGQVLERVAKNA